MKHFVTAVLLFASFSSSAFAGPKVKDKVKAKDKDKTPQEAVSPAPVSDAVITSINVTPANGGINPNYAGVRLKGTIRAGGNACEAQQYEVGLRKEVVDGNTYIVPFVERRQDIEPMFCILVYDMNFKGLPFDQNFVLENSLIPSTFVVGVKSEDNVVAIGDLLTESAESCSNIRPFCTKQLHPTTCTYGNITVSGNNKCEAVLELKTSVCSEELATFDETQLECQDAPITFE